MNRILRLVQCLCMGAVVGSAGSMAQEPGADKSVVMWSPGTGAAPAPIVRADGMSLNDFAMDGPHLGTYAPFGSVIDVFAGSDAALREQFRQDFASYLSQKALYPGSSEASDFNLEIYTYRKPYEIYQARFLDWLHQHTPHDDFIEPAGRRFNDYRGDLAYPVVESPDGVTDDLLKRTFGHVAVVTPDSVTLIGDNRYNPLRWIAPVNEVHHHEQASLAMTLPSSEEQRALTESVFRAFLNGDRSRRVILEYDIEIRLEDLRDTMQERTIWDFYGGQPLDTSRYLVGRTHWKSLYHSQPGHKAEGKDLHPALHGSIAKWLETRYVPINVHAGLMVNFLQGAGHYRLAEFMLFAKNQRPAAALPEEPGALGFIPTADPELDPYVVDGGCSGDTAWTRAPVSVLSDARLVANAPGVGPVVRTGGEFVDLKEGSLQQRFTGTIDLTSYYAAARSRAFFPGQRGYWVHQWVGFEGDVEAYRNPDEGHGIYWLGFIFENHGPFRISATVRKLNAYVEETNGAPLPPR